MDLAGSLGDTHGASSDNANWLYLKLRECYESILDSSDSVEVRTLVMQRLNNLRSIGGELSDAVITDTGKTVQSSISTIREALSVESDSTTLNSNFPQQSEINALPESPEKQYFFALLSLRSSTDNQGCLDALRYLESAISQDSENIIYRTLVEIIHDAID